MRSNVVKLGIGLIGAAMLLVGCGQDKKLEETQQQLTTATNELAVARTETAEVKTQMQAKVDELQLNITKLNEEKVDTEKKMQSAQADLEQKLQEQQTKSGALELKVGSLELDKSNMTSELKTMTEQIAQVNQQLSDLEKTHATTVSHLQAMRVEYVKLTNDKAALEARLHDLKSLKEQIVIVKQEQHQKKVEELKRLDRAEFAMGNRGYMLKEGTWSVTRTPGSYPLNQELYREQ